MRIFFNQKCIECDFRLIFRPKICFALGSPKVGGGGGGGSPDWDTIPNFSVFLVTPPLRVGEGSLPDGEWMENLSNSLANALPRICKQVWWIRPNNDHSSSYRNFSWINNN